MLLFWIFVFVCCVVKCDYVSNNYYIIEMPDDAVAKDYNTPFKVYWNVPTKQCKSKKIPFVNLEKFGIIQNQNDAFEGDKITILYDPGLFPAILKYENSGNYIQRNGGVPQQGNLEEHLTAFRNSVNTSIPDPDFDGIGVIDFESWRPIFRQQFGNLTPYIDLSLSIERQRHWWWPASWQKMEATKRYEDAARIFMQTTLGVAKQMRPKAIWGYYAYPYCYNMASNNMVESCSNAVKSENDRIYWLWAESTALFPSVYSSSSLTSSQLGALVRGRVTEANRVKKAGSLVLPYFWYRYRDGSFLSAEDVTTVFEALQETNASGLIIWGSSSDVNQVDKCEALYNYVENTLGPIAKKYIQKINRIYDQPETYIDSTTSASDIVTTVTGATLNEGTENVTSVVSTPETLLGENSIEQKSYDYLIYADNTTFSNNETSRESTENDIDNSDDLITLNSLNLDISNETSTSTETIPVTTMNQQQ